MSTLPHPTSVSTARKCTVYSRGLSHQNVLLRSCRHPLTPKSRRTRPSVTSGCASNPVPYIPFPGDNQAAAVYTAISQSADADETSSQSIEDTSNSDSPPPGKQPRIPHRWRVVLMMALAFVLCNMDKVNMSVAVIPMAEELGWSATDRGLVSSAFFWGYALTQIPAGYLSTKVGGAKVLLAGVLLWSLGTLAAPPLAHVSLFALCASRVFVGLGEGLAPSSATNVMARLIPERERSRAVSAVFGGLDVGSAVGLILCGPVIKHLGWPFVFYLFAVIGVGWCVLFPQLKPDEPDLLVPSELQPSESTGIPKGVPWGTFAKSPPVWAIIVAHFSFNWGYYTLLAWLPSYFELALGLSVDKSSLLTLIPYLAMTAMTPFVGPVADGLVSKGWSVTSVRKLAQGLAFAGPATCMLACAYLTPAGASHNAAAVASVPTPVIVGLLSVSFALGAWSRAGLYCNHQDLSPKYAGALLGITNTAGAFPGILGVSAVGLLLDKTNSWADALFLPTAACQLVGLVVYTALASSKRQEWE